MVLLTARVDEVVEELDVPELVPDPVLPEPERFCRRLAAAKALRSRALKVAQTSSGTWLERYFLSADGQEIWLVEFELPCEVFPFFFFFFLLVVRLTLDALVSWMLMHFRRLVSDDLRSLFMWRQNSTVVRQDVACTPLRKCITLVDQ